MTGWNKNLIHTSRGNFEVFIKGEGAPLCITHNYSEFNETGDYFAETFINTNKVYLVNLREAGNSEKASDPYQLSMLETVFDLEAIREALGFEKWGFAGHSTGGMIGIIYGIYCSNSLLFNVIVGAAAREYMTFSPDCIYHPEHPQFGKMQELIEALKRSDLSKEKRKELSIERTKLSLFNPERYQELFVLNVSKKMSASRMNYFSREIQLFDVTKKLKLITTPTLIICGKYDVQCPLTYSLEMNELISISRLIIFYKSNHYPFLEESDLFKKEFNRFLDDFKEENVQND
ncbi:alpha/beta fold hydrolase [Neobacillus massiliamazoniensis]|uniref:Prolyl aminopeptidase n=1 Tax=Neobacillus massiliamazoniensis TaxID=1499688 RepID=A0A0U1NW68_9BACI|nr:alpha/beta fold hydrolase [Neobacillus massiliamazoniensis]CRK82088.1 prolyl aminopeptidase [Neobacillus massiliamazoniensis]